MKKHLLVALVIMAIGSTVSAQTYFPTVPSYNDLELDKVIKKGYYRKNKDGNFYRQNASSEAFRDTVMSIFSQFAVGNNVYSKNANVVVADLASKEARLSYNAAAYWKDLGGIYNVELFATGKDNLSGIFGKGKFKGNFGVNISSSYLLKSSMSYLRKTADAVHQNRLLYAWTLEDQAKLMTEGTQETLVKAEISNLETMLSSDYLGSFKTKEDVFAKLTKLQDSLKKFLTTNDRAKFFKDKLTAYDKQKSKWSGFNMITMDYKVGYASEAFSHYTLISTPVVYPVITEDAKRFSRWGVSGSINLIHNGPVFASKSFVGIGLSNFIGFDGESADDISQSTQYDSLNVTRAIEKKYTAYELKAGMTDTYTGSVISVGHQMLFGNKKLFGFGFSCIRSDFFDGQFKNKVAIDNTYSLLVALSKRGDVLNKNVLAINFKTPDIRNDLPKSFDKKTGERLSARKKLEVGITFGLTIDKLIGK